MPTKYDEVSRIANSHILLGTTMPAKDLASALNKLGYRANRNTPYKAGRGIYKLISATYHRFEPLSLTQARNIARAFTRPDGTYAY
jgi:hypothetical protein